jgi:hypothetical protein
MAKSTCPTIKRWVVRLSKAGRAWAGPILRRKGVCRVKVEYCTYTMCSSEAELIQCESCFGVRPVQTAACFLSYSD